MVRGKGGISPIVLHEKQEKSSTEVLSHLTREVEMKGIEFGLAMVVERWTRQF